MKKYIKFMQSMGFGMLLLSITVVCALVGSVIEQGKPAGYYLSNYA